MIQATRQEFQRILAPRVLADSTVLEVGALPGGASLLTLPALQFASAHIGINIAPISSRSGLRMLQMDARRLAFPDNSFDVVISSSMLEHVPDFWRASDEMKRVVRPGGLVVISTPGFGATRAGNYFRQAAFKLRLPDVLKRGTLTMRIHDAPNDYYRFSEFAYHDIILQGLDDVEVWSVMNPPRLFGMGRKS